MSINSTPLLTCLSKLKTLSACERQLGELEALMSLIGELETEQYGERSEVPLGLLGVEFRL